MQVTGIFINMNATEYKQNWYQQNRAKRLAKAKAYREAHRLELRAKAKLYKEQNPTKLADWREANAEHVREYKKKYKQEHKPQRNAVKRNREATDALYKLTNSIRRTISTALSKRGYTKKSRTYEILGCSFDEFKAHIEQQFQPWMNWTNYGNWNSVPTGTGVSWDIDHMIPLDTAISEADVIQLNHYTNLQPLDSYINRNVKRATSNLFYLQPADSLS